MCFDHDARPPIPPLAGAAVDGERIEAVSSDGTRFMAFAAQAPSPSGAGMLILPDVRGLHRYYEELALRFAEAGVDALAIDYFGRTAGTTDRGTDFDYMPHVDQTRYSSLLSDVSAAAAELRRRSPHLRALFTVGFCYGGRLSFLAATRPELDLAGVVGFYGNPVGRARGETPAPADVAGQMQVPVLGLFGGDDPAIPSESVAAFQRGLAAAGVEHELVTYPGAPHSFFDRQAEQFADASADAWQRVREFVARLTPPPSGQRVMPPA